MLEISDKWVVFGYCTSSGHVWLEIDWRADKTNACKVSIFPAVELYNLWTDSENMVWNMFRLEMLNTTVKKENNSLNPKNKIPSKHFHNSICLPGTVWVYFRGADDHNLSNFPGRISGSRAAKHSFLISFAFLSLFTMGEKFSLWLHECQWTDLSGCCYWECFYLLHYSPTRNLVEPGVLFCWLMGESSSWKNLMSARAIKR